MMDMTSGDLVVAKQAKLLRRGREVIVFNAENVNPIYFSSGGDEAWFILNRLRQHEPFSSVPKNICSPELFEFFRQHSLVVPEGLDAPDRKRDCLHCEKELGPSFQRSLYLLLSQSCNQACIYCLNGCETYQKARHLMMPADVAFRAVEKTLDSIAPKGKVEIIFFGGEPLLNWELAKQVIGHCETKLKPKHPGKTIAYHLTTNLTILPNDLVENAKRYGITFLVDVDGPEDIHDKTRPFVDGTGSFKVTAKNIEKLVKAGLNLALRATVTSYNQDRMLDIAKTHRELGARGSAFVPLNPVDSDGRVLPSEMCPSPRRLADGLKEVFHSQVWPVKELFPFNEYLNRFVPGYRNTCGCGAPYGNTPVITIDGKIYSCIYLVGNKRYETGDLAKDDFPRQDVVARMLEVINIDRRPKCRKCGFRYLCGGGCPVGEFSIAGNPKASPAIKDYVQQISCTMSKTCLTELFWQVGKEKSKEHFERARRPTRGAKDVTQVTALRPREKHFNV